MKMNSTTFGSNILFKIYSAIMLFFLLSSTLQAKTFSTKPVEFNPDGKPAIIQQGKVLKGTVSLAKDLPQEFYGTWTVISVLVETNNPELFRQKSSDIWTFSRAGDMITLTNPINGASASITVTEVHDKTASFTRIKKEPDFFETETAQITVDGDDFYGTDTIIMKHFKNGRRIKTDIVKYEVRGYKISGPTLKDIFAE